MSTNSDSVKMEWETFKRAPIVEAVIAVGVRGVADPAALNTVLTPEQGFLAPESILIQEAEFRDGSTSARTFPSGFRFTAGAARPAIVQAREDGFALSHLAPYQCWADFSREAHAIWRRYVAAARPVSTTAVSVRYINRLSIPQEDDLSLWFHMEPRIGSVFTQRQKGFHLQFALEVTDADAVAVIQQRTDPTVQPDSHIAIVLDIDVRKTLEVDPDDERIWASLEQLRDAKNDLFFQAITEKAKESFR